jgi:hypothetical protein
MTRYYLDFAWFENEYQSEWEEEWTSVASDIPEWFEEKSEIEDYMLVNSDEQRLIRRANILVIVSLVEIDVIVIVIELHTAGLTVHYNRRSW